jgi:hypothetical protein
MDATNLTASRPDGCVPPGSTARNHHHNTNLFGASCWPSTRWQQPGLASYNKPANALPAKTLVPRGRGRADFRAVVVHHRTPPRQQPGLFQLTFQIAHRRNLNHGFWLP